MKMPTERLDKLVSEQYQDLTRSQIQKLIKDGMVTVEGSVVKKVSFAVSSDVTVSIDEAMLNRPTELIELQVIYEDDNCVVINKPLGVLTHSKGSFNPEGTVASWLSTRSGYNFLEPNDRSGIVHRLDRATSGVMICAKNLESLGYLQKQFQIRKAKKQYIARVDGHLKIPHAILDLPIERNPKKPQTFRVGTNGKHALTEYEVIKELGDTSLLRLKPTTGRTHQLRVHMKHIGNPIVGDTLYGGSKASRLYLHAELLEITVPGGIRKVFTASYPEDFDMLEAK